MKEIEKKNVIVLSHYYHPDIATTGQLLSELSSGLVKKGFSVNVITAFPTYDPSIRAVSHEVYQGVVIRRIWSTRFNKNTKAGKIMNSLSFFLSAMLVILLQRIRGTFLIVSNPPFLPLIGYVCSIVKKSKFIYLVHDVYPDIAVRLGYLSRGSLTVRLWGMTNRFILRSASKIIVLSEEMGKIICEKLDLSQRESIRHKIETVHNWADGEFIRPIRRQDNMFLSHHDLQDKFVVLYSGNMGLFHELEMVIEVAKKLRNERMQFLFIGDGGKRRTLEQLVKTYELTNVTFLPYQSKETLPYSLTSGHVSLVTLEKNIEGLAMPSKLYSTMAAGNPIVAICDENSSVARIIQSAGCGFSVRHKDIETMSGHLLQLMNDPTLLGEMGKNARAYFDRHFTLDMAIQKYERIIDSVQTMTDEVK